MNAVIRHVDRFDRFTFTWLHGSLRVSRYKAIRWISHTGDGLLYVLAALTALLLDAAREVHGGSGLLRHAGEFPAPESSEYRMSADAERFHKSGPSVLRRYLPYPAVVWIQRLVYFGLPLLVVGLPLTRVLPIVYRWGVRRRIYRWYGELSFIERAATAQPQLRAQHLQRLAEIEARVNRLRIPASFAWEAYTLRMHVQMVRDRLQAG